MASDEREIRTVHSIWIDAVNAGDLARLLALVAEDVVFLTPGQAPFGREGFSSNFMAAHQQMRICCTSELEEVRSEEHTSELQSRRDLVCRLLLEKKKRQIKKDEKHITTDRTQY